MKDGLFSISGGPLDMIIAVEVVHERQQSLPKCWINQDVHLAIFGQTLLRSLKSTQILIWPFFFLIGTMLASYVGCLMGLMKPEAMSFSTSSLILTSTFGEEISLWLNDMLRARLYIQSVAHQAWVEARHFCINPSKNILDFFEELGENLLLLRSKIFTYRNQPWSR